MKGKILNVFLLGTPGCGKSEVFRRLVKLFETEKLFEKFLRVDDFPKLWEIFQNDKKTGEWKRSRPTPDGGYKVIDDSVWDDILKEVNEDVKKIMGSSDVRTILFIEFSRPNYVHSITHNFSGGVLENSLAIYLDVPFEVCWERNVRRHRKAVKDGQDDHLVSREEMENTYGSDDKDQLVSKLPIPIVFISPDALDENDTVKLEESVKKAYDFIKKAQEG